MAKMKDSELAVLVQNAITNSEGYDGDELAALRKQALDYYYGRESAAPSMAGRSSQQSSDVADMVEAVLAQVIPAFEIDSVAEFEPLDAQDEDQAAVETDACNYVVMEMNNGYYELQTAIKDALLLRNGLVKVWIDENVDTTTHKVEGATDMERAQLSNASQPNHDISIEDATERDDGLWDLEVKETITRRDLRVTAVDITTFGWYANHDSIYLDKCPFCYERSFPTRSDLIEQGYSKAIVNRLPATDNDHWIDTRARNPEQSDPSRTTSDRSQDRVEHFECYGRFDVDGDGIAELIKVCMVGTTILARDPFEFNPYASGTPFLRPHRFNGISLFDKLKGVQDAKTSTLRQWADNQNHANNARIIVVDEAVNMSDATNSRPAGIVRARAAGMVEPFPFTDVGPSCASLLEYQDKMRSERGGASLDLQAAGLQIAGETAHGVERQMSSREQLAAMVTRTLAETLVRSVFQLVHTALRLYMHDPIQIRARGQFSQVDPSKWRKRDRINIRAGLSMAERLQKKTALEYIIARQESMVQAGYLNIMVDAVGVHNATLDHGRASGIDNPERYWLDPTSDSSKQAAAQASDQAKQDKDKADVYQMALLQLQRQIEENKNQQEAMKMLLDKYKHDTDVKFRIWETAVGAEQKEAEIVGNAVVSLGAKAIGLVKGGPSTEVAANGQ